MEEEKEEKKDSRLTDLLRLGIVVVAAVGVACGAVQEIRRRIKEEQDKKDAATPVEVVSEIAAPAKAEAQSIAEDTTDKVKETVADVKSTVDAALTGDV